MMNIYKENKNLFPKLMAVYVLKITCISDLFLLHMLKKSHFISKFNVILNEN